MRPFYLLLVLVAVVAGVLMWRASRSSQSASEVVTLRMRWLRSPAS